MKLENLPTTDIVIFVSQTI